MDFTNTNQAMRQMLQLLMQRMMGEESLERQKEYVDYSSDVYGKRQQENLAATEASRIRTGELEHDRTMEEKAYALDAELLKMPYFDRLSRKYQAGDQSVLPELTAGASLIGDMYDRGQTGQTIPQEMWSEATKYGDMSDIYKIFDRVSSNVVAKGTREDSAANRAQREASGAATIGLGRDRLAWDKEKVQTYGVGVKGTSGRAGEELPEKAKFPAIVAAADKALTSLERMAGGLDDEALPPIQKRVMQIRNRGILGGWASRPDMEKDLSFLESVYNPKEASAILAAEKTAGATAAEGAALDEQTSANLMMEKAKRAYIQRLVTKWGVDPNTAKAMADKKFRTF